MKTIETLLREEMHRLEKIAIEARKRLNAAPKGRLRITKKRGRVEYYYKSDFETRGIDRCGDVNSNNSSSDSNKDNGNNSENNSKKYNSNGRYMKKSEMGFAKELAQKDYDERIVKNAEERIKAIDVFLNKYEKTSLRMLYQKTNLYRRELISAPVISDEEYIRQWQAVGYEGKSFTEYSQEIITERGERVRSKSEKIIADKLYALGVPYRYEYPLILEGNIKIYPDFTILKMPEREEVYLEHLGMMDDSNYVDNTIYKFSTYEKNGIFLGVNLFVTYETSKKPLNTKALHGLIKGLFCIE